MTSCGDIERVVGAEVASRCHLLRVFGKDVLVSQMRGGSEAKQIDKIMPRRRLTMPNSY